MISKSDNRRFFWGWWIVIVAGVLSGLGHGFYGMGISALFKPISAELNMSRANTSVATGIGRFEGGLEGPVTGWLADKFGPKWIIFTGVCITAVGLFSMSFVRSIWWYYAIWGLLIGTGVNLALTIAVDKSITNWFVRKRGLAQGIKFTIISILGVVILPVVTWLVTYQGWRITCVIWGIVMLAGTPFILVFIKQKRPEYYGLLPDGAETEKAGTEAASATIGKGIRYASQLHEGEFTLRQALRTPAYWIMTVAMLSYSFAYGGFTVHCIPLLTDMGIEFTVAGSMMGIMVFLMMPSRFFSGIISDGISKTRLNVLLSLSFLLQAAGLGIFYMDSTPTIAYVMLVLFGLGAGATTPLYLLIIARYYGRKAFGSIQGSFSFIRSPIQFIAPIYTGWVFDNTENYDSALLVFMIISIISGLLLLFMNPPKEPAQSANIYEFI